VLQALLVLGRLGRLEQEDGTPADPPTLRTAVPSWLAADTILLGRDRTLRVIEIRPGTEPDDGAVRPRQEGLS
jgi:hypothetical protein